MTRPADSTRTGVSPLREEVVGPSANAVSSYSEISEAWLLGRARELLAVAQRTNPQMQQAILAELDELLEESLRRGDPRSVGQMLRHNIQARLIVSPNDEFIDPLMDEMLALGRRHSLVVLEAGAHALRVIGASGAAEVNLDIAPPAPFAGVLRASRRGAGWRLDWTTPSGGIQTTELFGPREPTH